MIASLLARFVLPAPLAAVLEAAKAFVRSFWDAVVIVFAHPSVLLLIGSAFAAGWWQGTTRGARQLTAYIDRQERALGAANSEVAALNSRVEAMAAAADARRAATAVRAIKGVPDIPKCAAECGLPAAAIAHLEALK